MEEKTLCRGKNERTKASFAIGQQFLLDMIEGGFIYIDKTHIIYDLIKQKGYFFLSRPRRFGKKLLVSTMEEIFSAMSIF